MAMEFDMLGTLRARLASAQEEREQVRELLDKMDSDIRFYERRMPRRSRDSKESLERRMAELEYQRTTTSMTLQQEKSLLREIDGCKGRIKEMAEASAMQADLDAKRDDRRAQQERLRTLNTSVQELSAAIKRQDLAQRLGVSSTHLTARTVQVPQDKAGEVIGRQGNNLRRLEEECGVTARLDRRPAAEDAPGTVTLHLEGTEAGLALALQRVNRVKDTVSEAVPITSAVRSVLIRDRAAVMRDLMRELDVHVDLQGERGGRASLAVSGVPSAIAALRERLASPAFAREERIPFDADQRAKVLGRGGENIKRVEAAHGVDLSVEAGELVLYGAPFEVALAADTARAMLAEVLEVEEVIPVPSAAHVSALLHNSGYVALALRAAHPSAPRRPLHGLAAAPHRRSPPAGERQRRPPRRRALGALLDAPRA